MWWSSIAVGDTVKIGKDVYVKIINKKDGRVLLGIEAPEDVPIECQPKSEPIQIGICVDDV